MIRRVFILDAVPRPGEVWINRKGRRVLIIHVWANPGHERIELLGAVRSQAVLRDFVKRYRRKLRSNALRRRAAGLWMERCIHLDVKARDHVNEVLGR